MDHQRRTSKAPVSFSPELTVRGFRLLGELGRGGMGIVYRARQLSLGRDVALKVLPPILASDPHRLERFRNEARVAASLTDSHILPVFDVLEVDGVPVVVMPFIDGATLARRIDERRAERAHLSKDQIVASDRAYLEGAFPLLDQLLEAVEALHRANILHRDIKPANLLVDRQGHLWLADFGLARLGRESQGTLPGMALGTHGYMSPEQDAGREVDARSDLFSVGATLYQALTLRLPYGTGKVDPLAGPPPRPSDIQRLLGRDLDAVLCKALEADVRRRYQSAQEFREDWQRVRAGQTPRARRQGAIQRLGRWTWRHARGVTTGLLLVALVATLGAFFLKPQGPSPGGTTFPDALKPQGPSPGGTFPDVYLTTEPAGAEAVLVPVDDYGELDSTRRIRVAGRTPVRVPQVPPGEYLVVARIPGHGFHEVYRLVPGEKDKPGPWGHNSWGEGPRGSIAWPKVVIPGAGVIAGMAYLRGGKFPMGAQPRQGGSPSDKRHFPVHIREAAPYYLDATEVTVGAFRALRGTVPELLAAKYPQRPPDFDSYPVTGVSFHAALDYAEGAGKRLPTEVEYECAATDEGRLDYPWGNDAGKLGEGLWQLAAVRAPAFDRTPVGVHGLYSGALEWTDSLLTPYDPAAHPSVKRKQYGGEESYARYRRSRVVRGGPMSVLVTRPPTKTEYLLGPRLRFECEAKYASVAIGFRCARSEQPRFFD